MPHQSSPKIHNYQDYRDYLRDWFKAEKITNPKMSFRYVSRRLGLSSPNHFQLVITKKRHFSKKTLDCMQNLLRLSNKEKAYFEWIFALTTEEDPEKKHEIEVKVSRLANELIESTVSYEDYGLLSNGLAWYLKMGALKFNGKTFDEILKLAQSSCLFDVETKDLEAALELLQKIKSVTLKERVYIFEMNQLKTEWDFDDRKIKQFHYNNLMLAVRSIPRSIHERFHSNVTIPSNPEVIEVAKKEIRDLCLKLLNLSNSYIKNGDDCKSVTSIQFAMFPFFQFEKTEKKGPEVSVAYQPQAAEKNRHQIK